MGSSGGSGFDRAASVVVTTAALAMAAVVIYRELSPRTQAPVVTLADEKGGTYDRNWGSLSAFVRYIGDSSSSVRVIEFTDLECPACRRFHEQVLPELRREFGAGFSLALIHLPLSGHRFARPAAYAAECAGDQGRFGQFVQAVFGKQDSLGLKSWTSFAEEAGVLEPERFAQCAAHSRSGIVDSGVAIARRLGINATPTLMVNGWYAMNPSAGELARVIREVRRNRKPYPRQDATSSR